MTEIHISKKLSDIQCELKAPKSQFNKFGNYKYRSCEDILEAVKPICNKHEVVITVTDELVLIGDRYYVKATACIISRSDEIFTTAFAREPESQKGMAEPQCTGSASSYARKYALNGLFAIDDTKDADTEDNSGKSKAPEKKKVYKNFKFLKEMSEYKKELGEEEYYKILGSHGYSHANEIPPANTEGALKVFAKKVEILRNEGGR